MGFGNSVLNTQNPDKADPNYARLTVTLRKNSLQFQYGSLPQSTLHPLTKVLHRLTKLIMANKVLT